MYGSAAMTGAQVVYDRHNLQKKLNNHYAALQAYRSIYVDTKEYKNTNVSVSTFNNVMLVTGQAPTAKEKNEIGSLAKEAAEDREFYNFIEVSSPSSYLTSISDSWITTKIKSQFIAANEIDPNLIKVITENGTVFLLGIVPPEQADVAVQIARETKGVQNVVKIFSYSRVTKT
jgi:osmotically-inducible protein OsmY